MQVPIGNYAGIKALKARYASKVFNETITVVENGKANVPMLTLPQNSNSVSGELELFGSTELSGLKVMIQSIDGTYEQEVTVNPDGGWTFPEVPLGEYTLTFFRER